VRAGEINNFTGIDIAYKAPTKPEIHVINYEQPLPQNVQSSLIY